MLSRIHKAWCLFPLILCLIFSAGCEHDQPVIRIGCQNDKSFADGVKIALNEINQEAHPFQFTVSFDHSAPAAIPNQAVESADHFCSDSKVIAVIGYASSDASLAASEIFGRRKMPQIVPNATSIELRETSEWTFKLCPDDSYQADFLAHIALKQHKAARCAIVYQNNDYGRGLARLFSQSLEDNGGRVVFKSPASSGLYEAQTDFLDVYAREIIAHDPDLVAFFCLPYQAEMVIRTFREKGKRFSLLGSDSLDVPHVLMNLMNDFTGVRLGLFYHHQLETAGNRAFSRSFYERYGRFPQAGAAFAYDAISLLFRACTEGVRTREEMKVYLAGVGAGKPPFRGVTGDISFNEERACLRPIFLGEIRSGRIVLLEE